MSNPEGLGGRPRAEDSFDMEQVKLFGRFRATYKTMADFLNVSERTIERLMADEGSKFCRYYNKGFSTMKMSLSEAQVNAALNGNSALLIWLGKQHLDQRDKQEIESKVEVTGRPVISFGDTSKKGDKENE